MLGHYVKFENMIRGQTEFSDKIRGPNAGEFYGLARVGPYSFANVHVAFRDNTKWCATVVTPVKTFWGEVKIRLFQNHAVSICEDQSLRHITEDEAHYIGAILNAPIIERYILSSSDERSFKVRPPIRIPRYDPNNKLHQHLSDISKQAHSDPSKVDGILSQLDALYVKILYEEDAKLSGSTLDDYSVSEKA